MHSDGKRPYIKLALRILWNVKFVFEWLARLWRTESLHFIKLIKVVGYWEKVPFNAGHIANPIYISWDTSNTSNTWLKFGYVPEYSTANLPGCGKKNFSNVKGKCSIPLTKATVIKDNFLFYSEMTSVMTNDLQISDNLGKCFGIGNKRLWSCGFMKHRGE